MKKQKSPGVTLVVACLLSGPVMLHARTSLTPDDGAQTVWQIGKFDKSGEDFRYSLDDYSDPNSDPVFVVGKSDPRKDWVAYQPGSGNAQAGFRAHPFTIKFDLREKKSSSYILVVALLHYTPRVPLLQVTINGHRGVFFQHPKLNYDAGDQADYFLPTYAEDTLQIDLPVQYLNHGENTLVLTAVDDPEDRDDTLSPVGTGSSAIVYDAIKLVEHSGEARAKQPVHAEAASTIFFKDAPSGLQAGVEAVVRFTGPCKEASISLVLQGAPSVQKLRCDTEFGERKAIFFVPEFSSAVHGILIVRRDGQTSRFQVRLEPSRKWTLYVVPHEHLDIGFTDYQAKIAEVQSQAIDDAMAMIGDHPEFRYSIDAFWSVEQFLHGRSQKDVEKFEDAVRAGHLFVPAQYANGATDYPTLEASIRSFYPAHDFLKSIGAPFNYANATDIPSYNASYASIMAAAGLKYFAAASNNYRAPILLRGKYHEKSPFWLEGPDGGKTLMWYARQYDQAQAIFGLPPRPEGGVESLPLFLQAFDRPEYKPNSVLVYGTQVENTALYRSQAELVGTWNKLYAYPRLKFTGFAEAIEAIGKEAGDSIPVYRRGGGSYWADIFTADAAPAAVGVSNEYRVLSAEKASTITSFVNPETKPDSGLMAAAWEDILKADEHTLSSERGTSDPQSQESIQQAAVKQANAADAHRHIDELLGRSLAVLANAIPDPSGTLVVFNSLAWKRSGLVTVDLDKGLDLVDLSTKTSVPYEVLSTGEVHRRIRFWANEVPSLGYKCYAFRPSRTKEYAEPRRDVTTLDSPYYRMELDAASGSVKSIYDKELKRELVDQTSEFKLDQYVYVSGGDQLPNQLDNYNPNWPLARLKTQGARDGQLVSITETPEGMVARLTSSATNTPSIKTEIILFRDQKKIEFINRVEKAKVYTKEGVYFAFPFALNHPTFRYDSQNGFIDPAKDLMPGADFEWFSTQQWIATEQNGVSVAVVPVDAHLFTVGDVVRGTWPKEFGTRKGTIFSYVMSNYWDTNAPAAQGGSTEFRYVLTSGHELKPESLSRLGWEAMSPFETDEILKQDKVGSAQGPLPTDAYSFMQVNEPNVVLVTWKVAQDGKGTILRFLETGGRASKVAVTVPFLKPKNAWACNAVEECEEPLPTVGDGFGFSIKPFEIFTVRLEAKSNLEATKQSKGERP